MSTCGFRGLTTMNTSQHQCLKEGKKMMSSRACAALLWLEKFLWRGWFHSKVLITAWGPNQPEDWQERLVLRVDRAAANMPKVSGRWSLSRHISRNRSVWISPIQTKTWLPSLSKHTFVATFSSAGRRPLLTFCCCEADLSHLTYCAPHLVLHQGQRPAAATHIH